MGKLHEVQPLTKKQALLNVQVANWGVVDHKSLQHAQLLVDSLKNLGYLNVETLADNSTNGKPGDLTTNSVPTFRVEGEFAVVPGPYFGLWIVWDILAGAPSVFAPIPLGGTSTLDLTMKIYRGESQSLVSTISEKVDYGLIGFSFWGLVGGVSHFSGDFSGIFGLLLNRELIRLTTPKSSPPKTKKSHRANE